MVDRLEKNLPVRRSLPDGGRVHIDRQLPFVVVYRPRPDHPDAGTRDFVRGHASYLIAPASARGRTASMKLVQRIADTLSEVFGGFLVIEIWSGPDDEAEPSATGTPAPPAFRVLVPKSDVDLPSVRQLASSLGRVRVSKRLAEVEVAGGGRMSPPGLPRISKSFGAKDAPTRLIGVQVRPVYRAGRDGEEFALVVRSLNRELSKVIQRTAYEFALHQTTHRPRHYQALGRHAMVKAVSQVDAALSDVALSFDLLHEVSPTNTEAAFRAFKRSKHTKPPRFLYRPPSVDPAILQRALYAVPIERVEDPTLDMIFREKRRELSLKLDLLTDRETPRFMPSSVTLFGGVSTEHLTAARDVLDNLHGGSGPKQRTISAIEVADRANAELDRYREVFPAMGAKVHLREDLTSLMVSNGHLMVGKHMSFPANRVHPLLQHEVGTHIVTYWNGTAQPLRLLATGLAGHDELQEGLAVFAEYLVDGLTPPRLRTLAARVVAVAGMLDGAEFIDTFELLRTTYGFSIRTAFLIAARVHRGGGFVKDAVYLRGLEGVVDYVADGGRIETLLVGKIATAHAPVIEELERRKTLVTPPLRPHFLDDPDTHYRLERVRQKVSLLDLVST
ncbi:MAG TPA: tyrosine/phenylalanine carboxypeptidase domain-containing protein [Acidimicrobiales bacterium]|nr:tyrosine/phenylalanine carboxypeptidase domain-containing protein [Acidimicrobiales bacterium]